MQKTIAKALSMVFHPVLMPTLGMILIYNTNTYIALTHIEIKKIIYGIVFLGTGLIPMFVIPLLIGFKLVNSVELNEKKERIIPLIISTVSFLITYYFILLLPFPVQDLIKRFLLSATVAVVFTLIISLFWKISAHMIGLGGLTGLVLSLSFGLQADIQIILLFVIFISGLVGTARLLLNAHSVSQVFVGYVLGMAVIITGFIL